MGRRFRAISHTSRIAQAAMSAGVAAKGSNMVITDIKIRKILQSSRLRAIVSVTLDDQLAVHDIKIIEGPQRLFVSMPSKREADGVFRDIVHPINHVLRQELEEKVLAAYEEELQTQQANAAPVEEVYESPQE